MNADYDAKRVRPAGGHILAVQVHEVADVEGVEDAPHFGRVSEVLLVGPTHQPGFERGLYVGTAQAECLHEVVVHSVFVDVEAGLH
jgi:hypothetical protein